MIRKATSGDIPAVAAIYERIHDREEAGAGVTGWKRGVYPTEATARAALNAGDCSSTSAKGRSSPRRASTACRWQSTRRPTGAIRRRRTRSWCCTR